MRNRSSAPNCARSTYLSRPRLPRRPITILRRTLKVRRIRSPGFSIPNFFRLPRQRQQPPVEAARQDNYCSEEASAMFATVSPFFIEGTEQMYVITPEMGELTYSRFWSH